MPHWTLQWRSIQLNLFMKENPVDREDDAQLVRAVYARYVSEQREGEATEHRFESVCGYL